MWKPTFDKVLVLALAAPVLFLAVLLVRTPSKGSGVDAQFWVERRASARIEARLTYPEADRYRPRTSAGGCPVPAEPIPLKELARLEEAGDWAGIAAAYGLQGEWNQAVSFLERMPATSDRDSDLAAVYLAKGSHEQALRLLDRVLASRPRHPQALWNRALVLRDMGLSMKAAETFDEVAALGEPGWSREAHGQALVLREETLERARRWRGARAATLALMDDPKAPLPLLEARQSPGVVRQHFYDVVRAAPSKDRVMALLPLAQELDRTQGGSALGDYVRHVATRDFSRRESLAKSYADVLRHRATAPDALLDTARAAGEDDLFVGLALHNKATLRYLPELLSRSPRQQDSWFSLYLEREQARKETADGEWWKAEQRLFNALQRCREGAFSARCVDLEIRVGILYAELRRLTEAEQHARTAWAWARQLQEWELELTALELLAHISRDRSDFSSSLAYVQEWSARGGRINNPCYWPQVNMAHIHYLALRPQEARASLEAAAACPEAPLDLMYGATFAEMARARPDPADAARMRHVLDIARVTNPTPGDAVYAHYIEGRFALDQDNAGGQAMLLRTIEEADRLPPTDTLAREAWTLSYSSLVTDAGRTGQFARVLELMAAQLGTEAPAKCALAAAVHNERSVAVVRGADGAVVGDYQGDHKEPFAATSSAQLVPERLRQALRGCAQVDVLAWAPVFGRTDLLAPDVPWSFRMGRAARPVAKPAGRRLVVSSVEAPALLQLPRLPAWTPSSEPEPTALEHLSGSEATPSHVLSSMTDATEIEIHAHGISDPVISDASLVVLSPEGNGRYALTADIVRQQKLAGSPLVFLAACSAGRLASTATHEPFSLPAAFIQAGARAVLASTVDIPDAAGRFFDGVRQRIRSGTAPAVALRDERQKWLSRDARNGWTHHVLLVETSD
ncbi:CHAT domain-containing protein [Myxococcus sp. K15C18031901]|uniref:CHAT domain-containing protein n=1 Tax=Myxococcus dinghuensis TaxID=2906761 RepID=UPI0020A7D792|nr:CHAT domain-containing protein [Myxococcus dinghuensis]MCP3104460.1 CHAT domain-containing protein [Myxococcus dinghuensis]